MSSPPNEVVTLLGQHLSPADLTWQQTLREGVQAYFLFTLFLIHLLIKKLRPHIHINHLGGEKDPLPSLPTMTHHTL